jgi:hypothetical protein
MQQPRVVERAMAGSLMAAKVWAHERVSKVSCYRFKHTTLIHGSFISDEIQHKPGFFASVVAVHPTRDVVPDVVKFNDCRQRPARMTSRLIKSE